MTVRRYASSDFPAVCRIYADARRAELQFEDGSFDITPLDQDPVLRAAFEESTVFVFENTDVVGFAALHETQLRALFVRSDARGTGVGTALLRRVLDHSPDLMLNVAKSNAMARRFYERHGFDVAGTLVKQYGDRDVEYVRMACARHLKPGEADAAGVQQ
ncbi:GNAT family N-acetyltransferase [Pseudoduganella umbonata]|nr:GNAT family N-acetyltransferase [Pseudoduganella umbonata]MBB3221928.1 ribosomal protein S18 acetylase RimI-like enzyme [Pseudoduganella umbonata]